jgi:flagellar biosynthesis/type III secretory pathway chaperone
VISAFVVSKIAWIGYYNILYSYNEISGIFGPTAIGNANLPVRHEIPPEVFVFMKDLSVASPALILITFLYVGYGTLSLLFSSRDVRKPVSKRFPFPSPYQFYYVQIGLIGTIFGFVIAFSGIDSKQAVDVEGQANILFQALGTALWSTLTAILLAYIVGPMLIEPVLKFLMRRHDGFYHLDASAALERMTSRAESLSRSLEDLNGSVNGLEEMINNERIKVIEDRVSGLSEDLELVRVGLKNTETKLDNLTDRVRVLESWKEDEIMSILKRLNDMAEKNNSVITRHSKIINKLLDVFGSDPE